MPERMLHYWGGMYQNKLNSGRDYEELKPSISILIADYKLKQLENIPKYHTVWNLREKDYTDTVLTNNIELHILEIPKIKDDEILKDELVQWLRDYFDNDGDPINVVVGCSGGKDSSVVLAALVEAIGANRVYAVLMPNGVQSDIEDSYKICEFLGLKPHLCNIEKGYNGILESVSNEFEPSNQAKINLAPVVRMATLKVISQSINGRFTCNGNMSELYLGWFTIDGDDRGSVKPLANLTATEVVAVGKELGLPDWVVDKTPSDGLCGQTDEQKFGFSYKVLDNYIRTGGIDDEQIKMKIDDMHRKNMFKLEPIPMFDPNI
jgi:NAD+ synthase